jgi:branched-chain amino acid aminotransferase
MASELVIKKVSSEKMKRKPQDETKLGFGDIFTDHMFLMDYRSEEGWVNPRIEPYGPLSMDPAAMGLHYGQEIFEGLKAYAGSDEGVYLFRPRDNFERMNQSASRMCMPRLDVEFVMKCLKTLILQDREWIPRSHGASLYIRPTMVATEPHLGVRPSKEYLFYIILGPVGAYYKEGLNPVGIYVEDRFSRAALGGTGDAKVAGNYAASLLAAEQAKKKGFTQVLWLDASEHKYVEEVGTMNMFFVIGDEVITAPLNGSILPGITRKSVIRLATDWGYKVSERLLSIYDVVEAADSGALKEAFGTGTAAVISPVGRIDFKNRDYPVGGGTMGALSRRLYDELIGLQYGDIPDTRGWVERIDV